MRQSWEIPHEMGVLQKLFYDFVWIIAEIPDEWGDSGTLRGSKMKTSPKKQNNREDSHWKKQKKLVKTKN